MPYWEFNDYNNWDKTLNNKIKSLSIPNNIKNGEINLDELIQHLSLLPNLHTLDISSNNLISISDIVSKCPNLNELGCGDNDIYTLDGLNNCPHLKYLYCTYNKLVNLSGIEECRQLYILNCGNNNITSLNALSNCDRLASIDCDYNQLENLKGINCSNLSDLNCNYNKLTSIDDIFNLNDDCTKISIIYCNDNKISSLKRIINDLSQQEYKLSALVCKRNPIPQSEIDQLLRFQIDDFDYSEPVATTTTVESVTDIIDIKNDSEPNPIILSMFKDVFCFNYIDGDDETIGQFLEDQKSEGPFIVEFYNKYTGNALNWLLREFTNTNDPKEFIECKDDTPEEWQGNAYSRYVKEGGRTFVNVKIRGSNVLVEKPDWFWKGPVPTAKIFQLIKQAPVKKYMTNYLLPMRPDFSALGSAHCQPSNVDTYKLVEVNESNAQQIADNANHKQSGGKRRRLNKKTVKTIKSYKKRKTNKKKINKKTTNKKTTNKKTIKSYKKRKTNKKTTNKKTTNKKTTNKKTIKTNKIV